MLQLLDYVLQFALGLILCVAFKKKAVKVFSINKIEFTMQADSPRHQTNSSHKLFF